MHMIGFRDRFLGLDGMHEAQLHAFLAGQRIGNQPHFSDRGHVKMRDARCEQRADQIRRRVRLYRIE